jgi:hypothetical protein
MHLHNHFEDEQIKSLWVKRGTPGVHSQYTNNGVYTDYDSIMKYHTGRPSPKGKLILHYTTTPSIEVAEDGETAKGFWVMAGVESGTTEPENVGAMPEFLYEPESVNVEGGKRVWAHWVWCQYAIDFLKQDGEWKVWHFRCLEVARAPFSENWITFAGKNQVAFDKVSLFWSFGCPVLSPGLICVASRTWHISVMMVRLSSCQLQMLLRQRFVVPLNIHLFVH